MVTRTRKRRHCLTEQECNRARVQLSKGATEQGCNRARVLLSKSATEHENNQARACPSNRNVSKRDTKMWIFSTFRESWENAESLVLSNTLHSLLHSTGLSVQTMLSLEDIRLIVVTVLSPMALIPLFSLCNHSLRFSFLAISEIT